LLLFLWEELAKLVGVLLVGNDQFWELLPLQRGGFKRRAKESWDDPSEVNDVTPEWVRRRSSSSQVQQREENKREGKGPVRRGGSELLAAASLTKDMDSVEGTDASYRQL
jgi:hypothetical protein